MAIIKCPHCGQPVSDNAETCPHCETKVTEWYCTECNKAIEEDQKKCPYCGSPSYSFRKRVIQLQVAKEESNNEAKESKGMTAENQNSQLLKKDKGKKKRNETIAIVVCIAISILFVVIGIIAELYYVSILGVLLAIFYSYELIHSKIKENEICKACGSKGHFSDYEEYVGERQVSRVWEKDSSGKWCNPYTVFGTEYHYIKHHKCLKCGHDKTKDTYSVDWHW